MDPVLVTLDPGGEMDEQPIHEGEEFGYVLSGKVQLRLDDKLYTVEKGECFYFASDRRHTVKNIGKGAAQLLWVVTPPTFYY
jgi:quercetin dioxygenase-like cupin family protein